MPTALSAEAGLKFGPIILGTFFKHYLHRAAASRDGSDHSSSKKQDLLWHEAFQVVKWFMEQSTKHTIEDIQEFANARIPTPPWIHVESVLIPISVCDFAATHLIKAFGGEDATKRVVGGTKWWQVRGIRGVDCQWICQKSHMQKARKTAKSKNVDAKNAEQFPSQISDKSFTKISKFSTYLVNAKDNKSTSSTKHSGQGEDNADQKNTEDTPHSSISYMDGTRCMLYAHGGGYYFGSIDQVRYVMQRFARKINGRVFAVNYRLAPQYPFPCALQDLLAAYIYLIDPPPGAKHAAVPPHLIVFGGDSAGASLCLAALQIIRDSGLPAPAAAVLSSPWCDLTHSFPSATQNTATDILPPYGLSLHKPSVLWPPPTDEMSSRVRTSLQERFGKTVRRAIHVESFTSLRRDVNQNDGIIHPVESGTLHVHEHTETIEISPDNARARTTQTSIPPPVINVLDPKSGRLVPQVLRICGHLPLPWEPENFAFDLDGKTLHTSNQIQFYCPNNLLLHPLVSPILGYLGGLPPLMIIGSEKEVLRDEIIYLAHKAAHPDRYFISEDAKDIYPPIRNPEMRSTFVHLQIYDDTAHVLPLFSFITPAKYCYRAIALFVKQFVIPAETPQPPIATASPTTMTPESETAYLEIIPQNVTKFPLQRPLPLTPGTATSFDRMATRDGSNDSGNITGNRFESEGDQPKGPGTAGDPSVYAGFKWPPDEPMIRERISFRGVIRPLEPESEIPALSFPSEYIGVFLEPIARRFVEGQALWTKKFAKATKTVELRRKKNLELAKDETLRTLDQFQEHLFHDSKEERQKTETFVQPSSSTCIPRMAESASQLKPSSEPAQHIWAWSWALDGERPPRSSIVSRRDTGEARHLAKVADLSVAREVNTLSGNRLWSVLVNFLTAHPSRKEREEAKESEDDHDDNVGRRGGRGDEDGDDATRSSQGKPDKPSVSNGSNIMRRFRSLGKRHVERIEDVTK